MCKDQGGAVQVYAMHAFSGTATYGTSTGEVNNNY